MKRNPIAFFRTCSALVLLGCAGMAWCAPQSLVLASQGKLTFDVPDGWSMKQFDNPTNQPPIIEFAPLTGAAIRMRVIVLWTKDNDAGYNRPDAIRKLMQRTGESQLFTATEQDVQLHELRGSAGSAGSGFWYALTDRAPLDGDFGYMLHGGYPVGPLLLDFTALARTSLRDGDKTALAIIDSARLTQP